MPSFKPCPSCNLSEFKSRSARDSHVYRCKKKKPTSSEPTIQQVSSPINEEEIVDRFIRGEIGEQDAVNEFERQWILLNPRPQIGYREWGDRKALEVDGFHDRLIKAKPSSPISQPSQPQPSRSLSLTEIAEMRAKELRGEVFTPTTQSEPTQQSKPSLPSPQRPAFDLGKAIKSAFSRFQKPKEPQEQAREYYESPYGYSILTNPYLCDICKLRFSFQGQHEHFLQTGHKCRYSP